MFEFLLSIRVSFWLVRVGRMLRRCAATCIKAPIAKNTIFVEFLFLRNDEKPVLSLRCYKAEKSETGLKNAFEL